MLFEMNDSKCNNYLQFEQDTMPSIWWAESQNGTLDWLKSNLPSLYLDTSTTR